jgi:MFS family permease
MVLWSGQAISICGTQVSQIAFPLLILALTGSPAQAGFAGGLRILPYVILSLPAGALVDRWNRKRTMILTDSGRALALASMPVAFWTGHLSVTQIYLVSTLEGTLLVFFSLSQTSALPRVVGTEQLPAAMAQNEGTMQMSTLIGPALGSFLYTVSHIVPFLVDAVSYAGSVISLLFIRLEFQGERAAARRRLSVEIAEGLSWLWRQHLVRAMGFLSAIAWIMLSADYLVVIVLARHQHAPAWSIGFIIAAGGVGGIVGAVLAGRVQRRFRFGPIIITCAWLWALVWPLYAVAPNPVLLAAVTVALFVVWPVYNVTQFSYRLALIPDHLQGRVNSAFRLIAFSGQPVGLAVSGALLQALGPRPTVLVLAIAPVCMAIGATATAAVRNARPLADVQAA